MPEKENTASRPGAPRIRDERVLHAHDCLQVMLIEYGDIHIETLGQLLRLTRRAEEEFSRICMQRLTD